MKKSKRLFLMAFLLLLVMAAVPFFGLLANESISVVMDGQRVDFQYSEPTIEHNRIMVPIRGIFEHMGFDVFWDSGSRAAILSNGDYVVIVPADETTFYVNDEAVVPDVPQQIIDGHMILHLRVITDALGFEAVWNRRSRTVTINTQDNAYVSPSPEPTSQPSPTPELTPSPTPEPSQTPQPTPSPSPYPNQTPNPSSSAVVLTFEEALELVLDNIIPLQDIYEELEEHEENREELYDLLRDFGQRLNVVDHESPFQPLRNTIIAIDRQIETLQLEQDILRAQGEFALIRAIVNLSNAAIEMEILESRIQLAEEQLNRVIIMHQHGVATLEDISQAEDDLAQMRLAPAAQAENNALLALNGLLRQPLTQETIVEFQVPEWDAPTDIASFVTDKIDQAPIINQMQIAVAIRYEAIGAHDRANRNRYFFSTRDKEAVQEQRDSLYQAYEAAKDQQARAEESIESAIRAEFIRLNHLYSLERNLQMDLSRAQQRYVNAQLQLSLGLVTRFEVENIRFTVIYTEHQLEKWLNELWVLQFGLMHPFLLAGYL